MAYYKASRAPAAVLSAGVDGPRNKPWALEWRIVHIYEQVCITYDRWNMKLLVFFDFVMDSQHSSLCVNLLSKPLFWYLRQLM